MNQPIHPHTRPCGLTLPGIKRCYNFAVRVSAGGIGWHTEQLFRVIGRDALDVADIIQREIACAVDYPFELEVLGSRGGVKVRRFTGLERLIGLKLFYGRNREPAGVQPMLFEFSNV